MYIIKSNPDFKRQERRERECFEKKRINDENNRLQGTHNPVVTGVDYKTPVAKKEYQKMLERIEATTIDKKIKRFAQQESITNKRYGSDSGTR
jgi:hypothetical protein